MIAIVGNRQTFITIPSFGIVVSHLFLYFTFTFSKQFQFCISRDDTRCVSLIFIHFAYRLFIFKCRIPIGNRLHLTQALNQQSTTTTTTYSKRYSIPMYMMKPNNQLIIWKLKRKNVFRSFIAISFFPSTSDRSDASNSQTSKRQLEIALAAYCSFLYIASVFIKLSLTSSSCI